MKRNNQKMKISNVKNKATSNRKEIDGRSVTLAFSLASFLNDVGGDIIEPFWPAFVTQVLGAPMTVLGLLDGMGEAIAALIKLPAGYLTDRVGQKKPFVWFGYLLPALARVGYAFSYSVSSLFPFKVLDRMGKLRDPPRDAMIAEKTRKKERGKTFGFLTAADKFGATLGPLIAYALFALFSYRFLFLIASIPSVIGALLIFWLVKEGRRKTRSTRRITQKISKELKLFISVSILFALASFSISFMIRYANELGISLLALPLVYLIFNLTASLISIPGGKLSDAIGRKSTLILSYLLYSVTMLGFATINWSIAIYLLFILYGLHYGILKTTQKAFVSDLSSPDVRSTAMGIFQTVFALCLFPASIIAGLLWDLIGPTAPFYYGFILSILGLISLKIVVKSEK
jgi:MFS family permease